MKVLALVLSTLTLGACLDASDASTDDSNDSNDSIDTTDVGRIATNGLTPGAAQLALNINSTQLTSSSISAMTSSANGRSDLTYIVGCALATGDSITSGAYTFQGGVGIAPGWKTAALTSDQAKQVSACFLSRLNATGVNVTISLRGTLAGTSGTETTDYDLEEGAFFGNIFSNLGANTDWYTCIGDDQLVNNTIGDFPKRKCATYDAGLGQSPCLMAYAGTCSAICTRTGAGNYDNCNYGGTAHSGVITTFLLGHL